MVEHENAHLTSDHQESGPCVQYNIHISHRNIKKAALVSNIVYTSHFGSSRKRPLCPI